MAEVHTLPAPGQPIPPGGPVSQPVLNVDAHPEMLTDSKVRLNLNIQYDWQAPVDQASQGPQGTIAKAFLREGVSLIVEDGKPIVAAQSADPIGDRQVTVEVKATVLK